MFGQTEYLQERKAAEFNQLVGQNNSMVITSNYKGITLTQPVQVLSVMPGRVIFQAPEPMVCFTFKEKVHLYSSAFREIVSARVSKCDSARGTLELADLTFTDRCWNERRHDRVQPRDPIYVYVEHKKALVRANLDNLSVGGMSLMACNFKEEALHTDHNTPVRLTLQLPGDDGRLDLKGKVIHARQTGRLVIIGVQLMANNAQEMRINRYVKARSTEILADLERIYREIWEQYWMPDLYH
jgi:hypothetical protein